MPDPADLAARVAALEADVISLREQVTDTHTLAAHADRDVAEFREEIRAQTRLLNLTREDMTELRTQVTDRFDAQERVMGELRTGMGEILSMLTELSNRDGGTPAT